MRDDVKKDIEIDVSMLGDNETIIADGIDYTKSLSIEQKILCHIMFELSLLEANQCLIDYSTLVEFIEDCNIDADNVDIDLVFNKANKLERQRQHYSSWHRDFDAFNEIKKTKEVNNANQT